MHTVVLILLAVGLWLMVAIVLGALLGTFLQRASDLAAGHEARDVPSAPTHLPTA